MAMRRVSVISATAASSASSPSSAARSIEPALPARSAPRAIAIATSTPLRMPPLAIRVPRGAASRASRIASAVGSPQSAKAPATRARTGSGIRCRSTSLQDVPPAPATSTAATPASKSATTRSGAMPQPTSLTMTGTSREAQSASILRKSPANRVSPSGWSASWSGLRCSTRASASSRSTIRRQAASPTPRLSWTAPRLASRGTSGQRSRTAKVASTSGCSSSTRQEPRPIATRWRCAAAARVRLIWRARGVPPVMHEKRRGASSRRPRKDVSRLTDSRSISGRARWTKR